MTLLLRARAAVGRPVVTLAGDDVAQVRDVVFSASAAALSGFTLAQRGLFGGPLRRSLAWADVHALGPDAVMVADAGALRTGSLPPGPGGDVLASRVITDDGVDLGAVTDAILAVGAEAEVVGYEFEASPALAERRGRRLFVPAPETLAVSEDALMVPAGAADYVRDDLAGFGEAVEEFRARLRPPPS